ncbi:MAG: caspase family protein [Anaerolineales bacterium]
MSRKLALIIGNSEYQEPKLAQLVKPGQDARGLAEVLLEKEIGAFDDVKLLVNEPEVVVRRAISRFFAQKNRSDLLLLYFSGHGVLDEEGQLYFAVRDTEHDALTSTAIAAGFVRQEMNRSLSRRQVLILDCCNSGSFGKGAKGEGESVGAAAAFEVTGYGRAVLTATDAIQYAWEKEQFVGNAEYSVFTHFLIEGLKTGAADNEGDADGQTALVELFDYARTQIRASNARQTPTLSVDKLTDPLIIARNPRPPAPKPIELPAELRQLIESPVASAREAAVRELTHLLNGSVPGLALAARDALKTLAEDDSKTVAAMASARLNSVVDAKEAVETGNITNEDAETAWPTQEDSEQSTIQKLVEEELRAWRKAQEEQAARARAKAFFGIPAKVQLVFQLVFQFVRMQWLSLVLLSISWATGWWLQEWLFTLQIVSDRAPAVGRIIDPNFWITSVVLSRTLGGALAGLLTGAIVQRTVKAGSLWRIVLIASTSWAIAWAVGGTIQAFAQVAQTQVQSSFSDGYGYHWNFSAIVGAVTAGLLGGAGLGVALMTQKRLLAQWKMISFMALTWAVTWAIVSAASAFWIDDLGDDYSSYVWNNPPESVTLLIHQIQFGMEAYALVVGLIIGAMAGFIGGGFMLWQLTRPIQPSQAQ